MMYRVTFYHIKCHLILPTIAKDHYDYSMIYGVTIDKNADLTFRFANKWSVDHWKLKHLNAYIILDSSIDLELE